MAKHDYEEIRAQITAMRDRHGQGFIQQFAEHIGVHRATIDRLLANEKVSMPSLEKIRDGIATWGERNMSVARVDVSDHWRYLGDRLTRLGNELADPRKDADQKSVLLGAEVASLVKLFEAALRHARGEGGD